MAPRYTDEFRLDAVRIATTSGLARPQAAADLGVGPGLRSKDASDAPKFLSNALGHSDDLDTLRRGVRLARRIFEQMGLKDNVGQEIWPGKDIDSRVGSNNLDDAIREHARTIFHPAGTCRMGPSRDPHM